MKIPRHKRILSDLFIYWYAANMTNSVKKIQFIECLWIKCICGYIDKDSIFSNTNQNIYRDIPTAEKLDLHFHDFTPIIATLCDPTDKKTAWRILSYTQIKLRTLQEHFIMDKVPISLPLYWSKEYSAISVSKILCKLDRMALPPFALADSSAALFNLVVRVFEDTILNSVIQPMLNAVSWNARRIARNLLKHYFIPWIRMTSDFFRTDIQACNSVF